MKNINLVNAYLKVTPEVLKGFDFILLHFANNITRRNIENKVFPVRLEDFTIERFVSLIKHVIKHNPSLLKDKDYQIRAIELQHDFDANPLKYEIV